MADKFRVFVDDYATYPTINTTNNPPRDGRARRHQNCRSSCSGKEHAEGRRSHLQIAGCARLAVREEWFGDSHGKVNLPERCELPPRFRRVAGRARRFEAPRREMGVHYSVTLTSGTERKRNEAASVAKYGRWYRMDEFLGGP